jgi:hypothetical protein
MMCICSAGVCQAHEHGDKPGPGGFPLQLDSHGLGIALYVKAAQMVRADPGEEAKSKLLCQSTSFMPTSHMMYNHLVGGVQVHAIPENPR